MRALCLDSCLVSPTAAGQVAAVAEEATSCHDDTPDPVGHVPASAPASDECRHGETRSGSLVRSTAKITAHHVSVDVYTAPSGLSTRDVVVSDRLPLLRTSFNAPSPHRLVSPLRL